MKILLLIGISFAAIYAMNSYANQYEVIFTNKTLGHNLDVELTPDTNTTVDCSGECKILNQNGSLNYTVNVKDNSMGPWGTFKVTFTYIRPDTACPDSNLAKVFNFYYFNNYVPSSNLPLTIDVGNTQQRPPSGIIWNTGGQCVNKQ